MIARSKPDRQLRDLFSVNEAAFVASAPVKTVNQAIDRKVLRAVTQRTDHRVVRCVAANDLFAYVFTYKTSPWVTIQDRARRELQTAVDELLSQISATVRETPATTWHDLFEPVTVGPITVDTREVFEEAFESLWRVWRSREVVVRDPEVRGGEPIVRNTRIPVYLLADLRKQGVREDVLLDDYRLTPDTLAAALLWADLHPPLGRPARKAPWHGAKGRTLLAASEGLVHASSKTGARKAAKKAATRK